MKFKEKLKDGSINIAVRNVKQQEHIQGTKKWRQRVRSDLETMDKEGSKDFGTSNFLEDMIEKKEKVTWMIRAHLE